MDKFITASNLLVMSGYERVLDDVSLSVGSRDFITIIGPNGAGKSMLLKCLMGLHKPDSGTVEALPDLKIGYVPQQLQTDNIIPISVRRFLRLRKKVGDEELQKIAEEVGIAGALDKPLAQLSGGELQRALLARSLVGDPQLLVLDEPAQNLDISGQLSFYKLLNKIYDTRDVSILMVSHDLHMVMASSKQVVCLYHHICCSGKPKAVTRDPQFISLFGQDMANMMSAYQHSHDHIHESGGKNV